MSFALTHLAGFGVNDAVSSPPAASLWGWWHAGESYTETSGTPTTLITADGTAIGSWKDLSGNGRHAYQTTAGNKPTYKTGIVNGLPTGRFSGDFLSPAAIPSLTVSIYCVVNRTTWASLNAIVSCNAAGPIIHMGDNSSDPNLYLFNGGFGASVSMSNAAVHLVAGLISSSSTTIRLDGGSDNTAAAAGGGSGTTIYIGSYNASNFWAGDITELLIYEATHNFASGDGLTVRLYLNSKYGLGLAI